ncbi:MAG TPA: DNA gyrase inhibitor YacG [Caulobacteraceae bacterium]|nr:DNA gyrase inhibitor YacG [Caulobacteraceae bacterium]
MTSLKRSGASCPMCRKPVTEAYRPFCSRRCADVDLQHWLTGAYVASGGEDDSQAPPPSMEDED